MKIPVADNRTIIGYASTAKQAEVLVRQTISIPRNFQITVFKRPLVMQEILGLPLAWVYSISYSY